MSRRAGYSAAGYNEDGEWDESFAPADPPGQGTVGGPAPSNQVQGEDHS